MSYPKEPGFRNTDTSKAAAVSMRKRAATIGEQVLDCLRDDGPLATFQIAERIKKSYRSTQPRTSEWRAIGKIRDSGKRVIDPETDKAVIVWELAA